MMRYKAGQTPGVRVRVARVEAQVIESRLKGMTYHAIAEEMHMSLRGVKTAFSRALDRVTLPLALEAKKELLEKARLLEASLWDSFRIASDLSVRATLGGRILQCQQRQSALLGADVPQALAVQLALAPPTNQEEAQVEQLKNLSVEELRAMDNLWKKATGKDVPQSYIETTSANVTPALMPPVSQPEFRPVSPSQPVRVHPSAPEKPITQVMGSPVEPPRPHRPAPPFDLPGEPPAAPPPPRAQPAITRQRTAWDEQIDLLREQMGMHCRGDDDPNRRVYLARIQKLERLRDLQGDPNASRET